MRRAATRLTGLTACAALALAACGGDSTGGPDGDTSEDEAGAAFDATWNSADRGTDEAQDSFGLVAGETAFQPQQDAMTFDVACPEGGSASFDGDVSVSGDGSSQEVEIEFDVDLDACGEDGIVQDGTMSLWQSLEQDEEGMAMSAIMEGSIQYSGEVEGTCDMDVDVHVTMSFPSLDEDFGGDLDFDIEVEESGTFCGYALEDLDADALDPDNFEDDVGEI